MRKPFRFGIATNEKGDITSENIYAFLDNACNKVGVKFLSVDLTHDPVSTKVKVDGKFYSFIEIRLDNEEKIVRQIIKGVLSFGFPCYYGDVFFKIPYLEHVWRKAIILHAPDEEGNEGKGISVVVSYIDRQCGIEFPTSNFSLNEENIIFIPLDMNLPIDYSMLLSKSDRIMKNGIRSGEKNMRKIEGYLENLARATKIYGRQVVWNGSVPPPVQTMIGKISTLPGSVHDVIDTDSMLRLGLTNDTNRFVPENVDHSVTNPMDLIGDLINPDSIDDLTKAMETLIYNLNQSKFRGKNINIKKWGRNRIVIEMLPEDNHSPRDASVPFDGTRPTAFQTHDEPRRIVNIDPDDHDRTERENPLRDENQEEYLVEDNDFGISPRYEGDNWDDDDDEYSVYEEE